MRFLLGWLAVEVCNIFTLVGYIAPGTFQVELAEAPETLFLYKFDQILPMFNHYFVLCRCSVLNIILFWLPMIFFVHFIFAIPRY